MTNVLALQRRLSSLGLNPGPLDGLIGPSTLKAINEALDRLPAVGAPAPAPVRLAIAAIISAHPKASRPIDEIIVHCTATPKGRDVSVETIREWHKASGWADIGYHWVVLLDGTLAPGRPEAKVGSHVAGHNERTLGIVYVGGVAKDGKTAKDTRTAGQREALLDACQALIAKYPTIRKVSGHNQYAAKACPSFDVRTDPLGRLV
jgi:N-acetylmuramoyl-L-alanine amidase